MLNIGPSRLRYPKPVQGEQRDQRMLKLAGRARRPPAVAPSSLRSSATAWDSLVDPRTADMRGG